MLLTSPKSRLVAFLLAFFLGCFGVHRFYVGRIGSGIAMLLCTLSVIGLLVSSVWAFVDWIVILCGEFRDADNNRLSRW